MRSAGLAAVARSPPPARCRRRRARRRRPGAGRRGRACRWRCRGAPERPSTTVVPSRLAIMHDPDPRPVAGRGRVTPYRLVDGDVAGGRDGSRARGCRPRPPILARPWRRARPATSWPRSGEHDVAHTEIHRVVPLSPHRATGSRLAPVPAAVRHADRLLAQGGDGVGPLVLNLRCRTAPGAAVADGRRAGQPSDRDGRGRRSRRPKFADR